MSEEKELTLRDVIKAFTNLISYLLSKWLVIGLVMLLFSLLGILYAWYQKPVYTAEITFTPETETSSGLGYAAIAAQFGFDIGGGSGSSFSGENLSYLINSKLLIKKTLFNKIEVNRGEQLMIDYYLDVFEVNKDWAKDVRYKNISFSDQTKTDRTKDSIIKVIIQNISESIQVAKVDKKADIVSVKLATTHEVFSMVFLERLVSNVIEYYTQYKVLKSMQNVNILQRQTDSVSRLLSGNIQSIAVSNDLNINPIRQTMRTGVQRRQVDAQVNGALYGELVKNLELAKLALRKETPLVHIIDEPILPLEKQKMGRLKAAIIFGVLGGFITIIFLILRRTYEASGGNTTEIITST